MAEPPFDLEKANGWFAIELNNVSWDLLESENRSKEDDNRLLQAAHASCHHWLQTGNALNHQRAQCLLANVHASLGYAESARRHAAYCIELSDQNGDEQGAFDRATAYACAARAASCAPGSSGGSQSDDVDKFLSLAKEAASGIDDEGEREVFNQILAT